MSTDTIDNTGVNDPVAEDADNFTPIPDDQLIDAGETNTSVVESTSETEVKPQAENFANLRKEIQEKKAKIDELEKQREVERSSYLEQLKYTQQQNNHKQDVSPRERILGEYEDDYVPSVGELRQAFTKQESSMKEKVDELEVMQQFQDYKDVLKNDFAPLIKEKPYLAQMIQHSSNKALAAYELGKMARAMQSKDSVGTSGAEKAQRIVENARKPGNVANVGGSSVVNKAEYYASMSDADFAKLAQQNLGEI